MTGHASGLITLNVEAADDAKREKIRRDLREPYRTLLGHFRHEISHYYWGRLALDSKWLGPFRIVFSDELYEPNAPDAECFLGLLTGWIELTIVLNELARSMGQADLHPFMMSRPVVSKLQSVQLVVREATRP
jgi:hypothetical protein